MKPKALQRILTQLGLICLILALQGSGVAKASEGLKTPLIGLASWYSTEACQFNRDPKCPTASGRSLYELEEEGVRFAAMWGPGFGTKFRVVNVANGKSTTVVIYDRGPHRRLNRAIDLSKKAFQDIAGPNQGIIKVRIERV